jgi:hypothetical protein
MCFCKNFNKLLSKIIHLTPSNVIVASVLAQLEEDGFVIEGELGDLSQELVTVDLVHPFLQPTHLVLKILTIGDSVTVHSLTQDGSNPKTYTPLQLVYGTFFYYYYF